MFLYSLSVVKYIKLNNNIHNSNGLFKCITSINIIKICKPLYDPLTQVMTWINIWPVRTTIIWLGRVSRHSIRSYTNIPIPKWPESFGHESFTSLYLSLPLSKGAFIFVLRFWIFETRFSLSWQESLSVFSEKMHIKGSDGITNLKASCIAGYLISILDLYSWSRSWFLILILSAPFSLRYEQQSYLYLKKPFEAQIEC